MTKALTVAQVMSWQPGQLTALATEWGRQASELRTKMDEQWRAVDSSRETWKGQAGEAMRARFEVARTQAGQVLAALGNGQTAATQHATFYETAKNLVATAKSNAEAAPRNFAVEPDGTCEITETAKRALYSAVNGDANRYSTAIAALAIDEAACTAALKAALANAADVDTAATAAIKAAFFDLPDDTDFQNTTVLKTPVIVPEPPKGSTPQDNRKYWDSLTPEQQAEAIRTQPATIGNLDGLPAQVRDEANRAYLATEKARLEGEVTRLAAVVQGNPKAIGSAQELQDKQARLADVRAIEQSLSQGTPEQPRMLLGLDTTNGRQVRAAVAVGDPDTADHVSVTTPGLTSNVRESLPGMVNEAAALQSEAQSQLTDAGAAGKKVSTIAWMGYDPPQEGMSYPEVLFEDRAQEAAQPLSNFYQGIEVANQNTDPHITALGHSYGSLATSHALQQQGGAVDDVVFYGSPGIGGEFAGAKGPSVAVLSGLNDAVESAGDLGLAPGHVYEMTEKKEQVGNFNAFGRSPVNMPWVTHLSTDEAVVGDTTYTGAEGHSEYGRTDTSTGKLHRSGYNLAAIVAGLPQNAIEPGSAGVR
ncbi:alpha/beta hydrolase [Nocardia caishijiensis]|uniref:Alpha/beta hydrolase family protein n=1 Tax=Nocardia caishijiensis TaxID=184756 RepID=A0ABQ6YJN0_9NOCA|nr:alpha/beta hydrolase [Nocardia caishijiensis]KAF0846015.1 alpha/beta hydrolase family protein [Nocardia caishijiensis]